MSSFCVTALAEAKRLLSIAADGNDWLASSPFNYTRNLALSCAFSPISYFEVFFLQMSRSVAVHLASGQQENEKTAFSILACMNLCMAHTVIKAPKSLKADINPFTSNSIFCLTA